ncbi:TonB-dependent receptor plug domain-containing protein [Sphingobacterium sp. IITKGP-BTPF85]|uniref:TonB-dependent receptor plug domain-containing protein n=1 Tax=Sphingobacterium sp. IITKGP-BTPF85 TaxID=1338009 RepID=UPI000401BE20|nr:TonB-dependent receptor plug domain-containing protein [Sphingobacterium sp. IITKGP-BTPF85]
MKRSILNDENCRHHQFFRDDAFLQFSDKKIKWLDQLVNNYQFNLVQYAFNFMNCLLKAIKGIAVPWIIVIAIFHSLCLYAQTPRKDSGVHGQVKYELGGRVISAKDNSPMQGVSIRVDAENLQIRTSQDGTFELEVNNRKGKIKFSHIGFKTQEINYTSEVLLMVKLIPEENEIDEVKVVSTGYQKIPKERATGSFEFVDSALFNRKVSTDFLSRLEDVVPGISSTKYSSTNRGKLPNINVRGVSSLNSNIWPLIVIDGVPYVNNFDDLTGYFNNINPNDIENISVLKDAAAASIWGAQSGNGVIVITTKKGRFNQPLQLNLTVTLL